MFFYRKWNQLPIVYNVFPSYLIEYYKKSLNNIKSLSLHFPGFSDFKYRRTRCWNPKNPFYPEWKFNLGRAEFINLKKIPPGEKWNYFQVLVYSFLLEAKYLYARLIQFAVPKFAVPLISRILPEIFRFIKNFPLMVIGLAGQMIKKINPRLYNFLKGDKSGKNRAGGLRYE